MENFACLFCFFTMPEPVPLNGSWFLWWKEKRRKKIETILTQPELKIAINFSSKLLAKASAMNLFIFLPSFMHYINLCPGGNTWCIFPITINQCLPLSKPIITHSTNKFYIFLCSFHYTCWWKNHVRRLDEQWDVIKKWKSDGRQRVHWWKWRKKLAFVICYLGFLQAFLSGSSATVSNALRTFYKWLRNCCKMWDFY